MDWANQVISICFSPSGEPFFYLPDGTYRVTAVNGQLDIAVVGGATLGRGIPVDSDGTVHFTYRTSSGQPPCFGIEPEFVFDFTFTFNTNGTGNGSAHWTYGTNTNCFVCDKTDTAILRRTALP